MKNNHYAMKHFETMNVLKDVERGVEKEKRLEFEVELQQIESYQVQTDIMP